MHTKDLIEEPKGTIYFPWYFGSSTLVVGTADDPRSLAQTIREQVLAVDANQPLYDIQGLLPFRLFSRDSVWRFDCGQLCEEANLLYQDETPNFSDG